jgi:FAD:protein FMN transferase
VSLESYTFEFYALGSDCKLQLFAPSRSMAQDAAAAAEREAARIEARYSRYRDDSELSRINAVAKAGGSLSVDSETAGLIDYAYACHRKSGGLFDITSGLLRRAWNFSSDKLPDDETIATLLPRIGLEKVQWHPPTLTFTIPNMELDLGGIGKEYAADRAAALCNTFGIEHGLVDFGGDIRLIGLRPNGELWRIGVRHARSATVPMAIVDLGSGAIATSGDYERFMDVDGERYCHIVNPRTGRPAQGLRSVSVVANDCLVAGSLATTAMLKGRDGIEWLRTLGVRHVFMDEDGVVGGTEATDFMPSC